MIEIFRRLLAGGEEPEIRSDHKVFVEIRERSVHLKGCDGCSAPMSYEQIKRLHETLAFWLTINGPEVDE